jgi:hypothetical protein
MLLTAQTRPSTITLDAAVRRIILDIDYKYKASSSVKFSIAGLHCRCALLGQILERPVAQLDSAGIREKLQRVGAKHQGRPKLV